MNGKVTMVTLAMLILLSTQGHAEEVNRDARPQAKQESAESSEPDSHLWSVNCGRCHNKRSPEQFSDQQWGVILRHMRLRANLTGEEERMILAFLRSAN